MDTGGGKSGSDHNSRLGRWREQSDRRAVSKVVGVVLMTAIVIVLAATVATMLTGFAGMLNDPAPQIAFEFTYHEDVEDPQAQFNENITTGADEVLVIEHVGGEAVDPDDIEVISVIPNDSGDEIILEDTWAESSTGSESGPRVTGTMYPHAGGGYSFRWGKVTVVWHDPDSSNSHVLAEWEGPERE